MKRIELYEAIIRSILSSFPDIPDNDVLTASIGVENLSKVIDDILTVITPNLNNIIPLLTGLKLFTVDLDEDVPDYSNLRVQHYPYRKPSNERAYVLNENDLTLIDSGALYMGSYDEEILSIVLKICYDANNRTNFLSFLVAPHHEKSFHLIYDTDCYDETQFDNWDMYHYALLRYLNKGNIINRDSNLEFPANQRYPISANINFDSGVKYNQFIDVYDVISEFNHTTDVLSAFVKMYQILEYIIYRKELVKIIEGANIKQSFVRQVKGIDRKYLNGEREAFTDGLFRIIDSFDGEIKNTDITQGMIDFCKKYYERTVSGNSYINSTMCNDEKVLNKSIAKFIYDTRCAIVHNKEAEFHITYFNYDEYSAIIPLMKKVINGISKRIITLMNTPKSEITFTKDHLELY